MLNEDILVNFGFSKKEAFLYIKLLEMKEASVNDLSRASGIPRVSIYDLTEGMHKKGFITEIEKNKKKFFSPVDPNTILNKAQGQITTFKEIIPFLINLTSKNSKFPKIKFFEGLEALKEIYYDTLTEKNCTIYSYLDKRPFPPSFQKFIKKYIQKRVKCKIFAYVICALSPEAKKYKKEDSKSMRETKLVDKPWFELSTEIQIYGNKVSIANFGEYKIGIIIEDKNIASSMQNIFKLLWENLKESENS